MRKIRTGALPVSTFSKPSGLIEFSCSLRREVWLLFVELHPSISSGLGKVSGSNEQLRMSQ